MMPSNRWVTIRNPEPGREYLALLSFLSLRKLSALLEFFGYGLQILAQLRHAPGLIGYSLYARPFQMKFWTLSVWESDEALMEFVRARPHSDVMTALRGKIGETRFIQWKIMGLQYPPTWHGAFKHR